MNRIHISTRGIGNWRERLANPERQWRRGFSAYETAVSWELASKRPAGLPGPIEKLFADCDYTQPVLLLAIPEHKVDLLGGAAASQCDVWALVKTGQGVLSLAVEAKAREPFGDMMLCNWLDAGETDDSKANRKTRWQCIRSYLPTAVRDDAYLQVRYQLLHRCAASVIEAKRFGLRHAAFVVQAFNTPHESFIDYEAFCRALHIPATRGSMHTIAADVDGIVLSVGWADCPLATDKQVADTA